MFSPIRSMAPTDADLAAQALREESSYKFPYFSSADAITLGLSIRKRFRATSRHAKGKGLVLSVQSIVGHTLFSCTVGDLDHASGMGDVSLDSWSCLEGMIRVVQRTGHSSFYVEKGMNARKQLGSSETSKIDPLYVTGGAFPIWLENGHCCPIAVVACYSGSSNDDHYLVSSTVRDFIAKITRSDDRTSTPTTSGGPTVPVPDPSHAHSHTHSQYDEHDDQPESEWSTEMTDTEHREYQQRSVHEESAYEEH